MPFFAVYFAFYEVLAQGRYKLSALRLRLKIEHFRAQKNTIDKVSGV